MPDPCVLRFLTTPEPYNPGAIGPVTTPETMAAEDKGREFHAGRQMVRQHELGAVHWSASNLSTEGVCRHCFQVANLDAWREHINGNG